MPTTRPRLTGTMSQRLRQAREAAGLTQQDVARLVGTALKTVSNYENPTYTGARKAYIVREWAEVTGRNFEELWGSSSQPLVRTGWLNRKPVRRTRAA